MHTLENQLDVLNAKVGAQASVTLHGLRIKLKEVQGHQSKSTPCTVVSKNNQEGQRDCPSHRMLITYLDLLLMVARVVILYNLVPRFLMVVLSDLVLNHQNILLVVMMMVDLMWNLQEKGVLPEEAIQ